MIRRRALKPWIEVQFRSGLHSFLHHLNLNTDGEQVIQLSFTHFWSFIVKPTWKALNFSESLHDQRRADNLCRLFRIQESGSGTSGSAGPITINTGSERVVPKHPNGPVPPICLVPIVGACLHPRLPRFKRPRRWTAGGGPTAPFFAIFCNDRYDLENVERYLQRSRITSTWRPRINECKALTRILTRVQASWYLLCSNSTVTNLPCSRRIQPPHWADKTSFSLI